MELHDKVANSIKLNNTFGKLPLEVIRLEDNRTGDRLDTNKSMDLIYLNIEKYIHIISFDLLV